jgi:hypothetical protein
LPPLLFIDFAWHFDQMRNRHEPLNAFSLHQKPTAVESLYNKLQHLILIKAGLDFFPIHIELSRLISCLRCDFSGPRLVNIFIG